MGEIDDGRTETDEEDTGTAATLALSYVYASCPPERLFAYWTQPDLLTQWWPQVAEVDARTGGSYHLAWPAMGWHLRGRYTEVREGELLAFTWKWDGDEEGGHERTVRVVCEPLGDGTQLTVTHGTYGDSPEEAQIRAGHVEGWTHFLGKLQALLPR